MKYFLTFFLSAVFFAAQAQEALVNIEYLIENGRGSSVYQDLNAFIKTHPSNPQGYFLRAKYYFLCENHKAALKDVDFALKYRQCADYYELKGDVLSLAQKYALSSESFSKALLLDTLRHSCRYKAAKACFLSKNYKEAEKLLKNRAESDSAKLLLSEIFLEGGDGISALKTVNTVQKHDAGFYRLRGIIYCRTQMYSQSIDDLNAALDLNPSLTDIYLWRGLAYYFSGRKAESRRDWNTALNYRLFKANEYLEKYR
jgi:tetratricopeptide (TPR) repeat protein